MLFELRMGKPRASTGLDDTQLRWKDIFYSWLLEIAAIVLSYASFIALAITLACYDGHPSRSRLWGMITLNSLIAILSTISRASILFAVAAAVSQSQWLWFTSKQARRAGQPFRDLDIIDQASRGAWGSVIAIYRMQCRHLVCLGALIIILSLAFDTFSQQLLATQQHMVASMDPATVGTFNRAEYYGALDNLFDENHALQAYDLNIPLRAAKYNGIAGLESPPSLPHCSSGNCTWPIMPSLGICGTCRNLTGQIELSNVTRPIEGASDVFATNLTWKASAEGPQISQQKPFGSSREFSVFNITTYGAGLSKTTGELSLGTIGIIAIPFGVEAASPDPETYPPRASECTMLLCVQALNISMQNQTSAQRVVSISTKFVRDSDDIVSFPNYTAIELPSDLYNPSQSKFTILGETFTQTVSLLEMNADWVYHSTGQSGAVAYENPDVGAAVWYASDNIKTWFDNLTTLLSTAMRAGGTVWNSTDSSLYAGTSLSSVVVYHVRWAWIVYPVTILVVSTIFVVLNIWRSCQQNIGSVKDSATALACVKLDEALEETLIQGNGALHRASDLIGNERVQLLEENGFVLLKRVEALHSDGSDGDPAEAGSQLCSSALPGTER